MSGALTLRLNHDLGAMLVDQQRGKLVESLDQFQTTVLRKGLRRDASNLVDGRDTEAWIVRVFQ